MTTAARDAGRAAFLAFAVFGAFWGVWGASVPRIQGRAGVGDGELGLALMFVGAGALPAMLLTGRALDRLGLALAGPAVAALGLSGAAMAYAATGLTALCVGLALVGAASGAADVAMNAVAGRAEVLSGRPVITRAHGVFSASVVAGSLGTGLGALLGAPAGVPFLVVAAASLAAGHLLVRTLPGGRRPVSGGGPAGAAGDTDPSDTAPDHAGPGAAPGDTVPGNTALDDTAPVGEGAGGLGLAALVALGLLGALAFASENAHQSWSAVFAHVELGVSVGIAAVAPAVFAGVVAVARFAIGSLGAAYARRVLLAGALTAAAGAGVVAVAPSLAVAVAGLVLAAAGTGVLFPTLMGIVSRAVEERKRGSAVSIVTSVAYTGFLLGPVYVGLWAESVGLRGAMLGVGALGLLLLVLVPAVLSRVAPRPGRPVRLGRDG